MKGIDSVRDAKGVVKAAMKAFGTMGRTPRSGGVVLLPVFLIMGKSRMTVF